jgi:hypothetical protein
MFLTSFLRLTTYKVFLVYLLSWNLLMPELLISMLVKLVPQLLLGTDDVNAATSTALTAAAYSNDPGTCAPSIDVGYTTGDAGNLAYAFHSAADGGNAS